MDKNTEDLSLQEVHNAARIKFNMKMHLQFMVKSVEGVEEFGFASSFSNDAQVSLFLNEIPLFRLFIKKFREDNKFLLSKFEDNYIDLGKIIGPSFYEKNEILMSQLPGRDSFFKEMGITESLDLIERTVLKSLLEGHSASQIARIVCRSKRTVEHRIEQIKEKLACHSRTELVQKGRELESFGYFHE